MLRSGDAQDDHAKVCEMVERGFAALKEWLDMRFQHQEDILRGLSEVRGFSSNPESVSGMPVKDSIRPLPKAVYLSDSTDGSKLFHQSGGPKLDKLGADPLRITAACVMEVSAMSSMSDLPSEGSLEEVRDLAMPLPGCPTEVVADFQSGAGTGATREPPLPTEPPAQIVVIAEGKEMNGRDVSKATSSFSFQDQDWQARLMDVFDQLDLDRSGSIDRHEFSSAFDEVGLPPVGAFDLFKSMDETHNGVIDRIEWLHCIEEASRGPEEEIDLLVKFIERLAERQQRDGRIYETDRKHGLFLLLRHDKPARMAWDLCMMVLLCYIALTLPFTMGFGTDDTLETIDRVLDFIFCCDVVLNFRTTFADRDESIIVNGRQIACKYLKSWFFLDFLSSCPFDLITSGLMPSFTPARLLKIGKIAKVMKLLRISKMMKVFGDSELMEKVEEKSTSKAHLTFMRVLKLVCLAFILAHWLACFGSFADEGSLEKYFGDESPTVFQKYLAAMYWAMMTLSTVGYGDITPTSDWGRLYCMIAMVIGGAFYGYIIGTTTSIVSDMDLNARAFYDRMDLIQAWLDGHDDQSDSPMPKMLRRRVRKHFKMVLSAKSAMDDSSVTSELSPELRADTAFFIINEQVRCNPMFFGISNSALANLVGIVQKNHTNKNECIVRTGDPGIAMYILVDGAARYDKGVKWKPPGAGGTSATFQQLLDGDSFGEEIIFGMEETYLYTITAISACSFHSISEDGFQDQYKNMPDLRNQMYACFMKSRSALESDIDAAQAEQEFLEKKEKAHANVLNKWHPVTAGGRVKHNPVTAKRGGRR